MVLVRRSLLGSHHNSTHRGRWWQECCVSFLRLLAALSLCVPHSNGGAALLERKAAHLLSRSQSDRSVSASKSATVRLRLLVPALLTAPWHTFRQVVAGVLHFSSATTRHTIRCAFRIASGKACVARTKCSTPAFEKPERPDAHKPTRTFQPPLAHNTTPAGRCRVRLVTLATSAECSPLWTASGLQWTTHSFGVVARVRTVVRTLA